MQNLKTGYSTTWNIRKHELYEKAIRLISKIGCEETDSMQLENEFNDDDKMERVCIYLLYTIE